MKKICCICGKAFNGDGNNPEPVMPLKTENGENRCCNDCNYYVVYPVRTTISKAIDAERKGNHYFDMPPRPVYCLTRDREGESR